VQYFDEIRGGFIESPSALKTSAVKMKKISYNEIFFGHVFA
jgi:hypothetical protein